MPLSAQNRPTPFTEPKSGNPPLACQVSCGQPLSNLFTPLSQPSCPSLPPTSQTPFFNTSPKFREPAKYVLDTVLSSRDTAGRQRRPENTTKCVEETRSAQVLGHPRWAAGIEETLGDQGPGAVESGSAAGSPGSGAQPGVAPRPRVVSIRAPLGGAMKCSQGPSK